MNATPEQSPTDPTDPTGQPPGGPPQGSRNRWILGGAVVGIAVLAIVLFLVLRPDDESTSAVQTGAAETTTATTTTQETTTEVTTTVETTTETAPTTTAPDAQPQRITLEVQDGQPVGGIKQVDIKQGTQVLLVVRSDVDGRGARPRLRPRAGGRARSAGAHPVPRRHRRGLRGGAARARHPDRGADRQPVDGIRSRTGSAGSRTCRSRSGSSTTEPRSSCCSRSSPSGRSGSSRSSSARAGAGRFPRCSSGSSSPGRSGSCSGRSGSACSSSSRPPPSIGDTSPERQPRPHVRLRDVLGRHGRPRGGARERLEGAQPVAGGGRRRRLGLGPDRRQLGGAFQLSRAARPLAGGRAPLRVRVTRARVLGPVGPADARARHLHLQRGLLAGNAGVRPRAVDAERRGLQRLLRAPLPDRAVRRAREAGSSSAGPSPTSPTSTPGPAPWRSWP